MKNINTKINRSKIILTFNIIVLLFVFSHTSFYNKIFPVKSSNVNVESILIDLSNYTAEAKETHNNLHN